MNHEDHSSLILRLTSLPPIGPFSCFNLVPVRQMSNIQRNKKSKEKDSDDEESDESEDEDEEEEDLPDLETATMKHHGCVNRIRVRIIELNSLRVQRHYEAYVQVDAFGMSLL